MCYAEQETANRIKFKNQKPAISKMLAKTGRRSYEHSKIYQNDKGFTCLHCGAGVKPLNYTSREHCPECLTSIHVDVNPGDRANECRGLLLPIGVSLSNQKGYIIEYQCTSCGQRHNNKAANDDNFKTILSVMNKSYDAKTMEVKNKTFNLLEEIKRHKAYDENEENSKNNTVQ